MDISSCVLEVVISASTARSSRGGVAGTSARVGAGEGASMCAGGFTVAVGGMRVGVADRGALIAALSQWEAASLTVCVEGGGFFALAVALLDARR